MVEVENGGGGKLGEEWRKVLRTKEKKNKRKKKGKKKERKK